MSIMEAKEVTLLLETAKYFIGLADKVMKSNIRISQEAVNLFNDYFVKQFVFINYLQSMNYSFGGNYNIATNLLCGSFNDNSQQMPEEKYLCSAAVDSASYPSETDSSNPVTLKLNTGESLDKGSKAFIDTSLKQKAANELSGFSNSITGFFTNYIDCVLAKKIQSSQVYCIICDNLFKRDREWSVHVFDMFHRESVKLLVSHGKRMKMYDCPFCVVSIYGEIDNLQSFIEYHNNFIHSAGAEKSDKGLNGSSNIVHSVSSESLRSKKESSNTSLYSNKDINYSSISPSTSTLPNQVNKKDKCFKAFIDKSYFNGVRSFNKFTFCHPCVVWCCSNKDWNSHSNGKSHWKTSAEIISRNEDLYRCNECGLSIFGLSSSIGNLIEYHSKKIHTLKDEKSSTSTIKSPLPKYQASNISPAYLDSILKYLKKINMKFYCALCDKYLDNVRLKAHVSGILHKNNVKAIVKSQSLKMFKCTICPDLTAFGEENFVLQLFEQHLNNHKKTYLEQNKDCTYNDVIMEIDWIGNPDLRQNSVKNTFNVNSKNNVSQDNINESKVKHLPSTMDTFKSSDIQKKQNDKQLSKDENTRNSSLFSNKGNISISTECLKDKKINKGNTSSNNVSKKGSLDKSGPSIKSCSAVMDIASLPSASSGYSDNDDCITKLFLGYIDALSVKLITDVGVYCHPCDIVLNKGVATSTHFSSKKHIAALNFPDNLNAVFKDCDICKLSVFGGSEVLPKLFEYHLMRNHNYENDISAESSVDKTVNKKSKNNLSGDPEYSNLISNDNAISMEINSHLIPSKQSSYSVFENLIAGMAEEFSSGIEAEGGYCTVCNLAFLMDAFNWEFHIMEHRNDSSKISQGTLKSCDICCLKIFGTDHDKFFNMPCHKGMH